MPPDDSGAGGNTPPAPSSSGDTPPAPAPPPAASAVMNSDATEGDAAELVKLKRERDELAKGKRDAETRAAELADENRRLKEPAPVPITQQPAAKKSWLSGATYFGED